jgi:hypothetical protein
LNNFNRAFIPGKSTSRKTVPSSERFVLQTLGFIVTSPSEFSINSLFINESNLDEQKSRGLAFFLEEEDDDDEEDEDELTSKDGSIVLTMQANRWANKT